MGGLPPLGRGYECLGGGVGGLPPLGLGMLAVVGRGLVKLR